MAFSVERIDHDADIGIIVRAENIEELFRGAALGMLEILIDTAKIESRTIRIVSAKGKKTELLLLNFLSEILDLVLYDGFAALDVQVGEVSENFVVAEVAGQRTLPENAIIREIKGVTYHMLSVGETVEGGFEARVIFDL